jgi:tripartite-type tricarboxylate transporter receptor subunit TctC
MLVTRRRWLVHAAGLASLGGCARQDGTGSWPTRPVRLVVPFGAGSSADLAARLFAPLLAVRWGQPVVVDNRPGGDGVAGAQSFVTGRDPHALLFSPMGVVTTSPLLHARLPFDPQRDLVPIAAAVRPNIAIAAARALGAASLHELVARVRAQPGAYLWAATPGLPTLVFRGFLKLETLDMRHVMYRDVAPAVRDLDAGRVHVMVAAVPTLTPALGTGAARLLAVTTSTRARAWPDVPTTREAGYPALTVEGPFGLFGWRDMPLSLRQRIAGDVRDASTDADLAARLSRAGFVVDASTPEAFAEALSAQRRQVDGLARLVGLARPGEGTP